MIEKILIGLTIILLLIAGYLAYPMIHRYEISRDYDGLRIGGNQNHAEAIKIAQGYDEFGDWVCVNVRGMTYERGVEVCQHEMAHEIFAEIIENNPEKIPDVMEVIRE